MDQFRRKRRITIRNIPVVIVFNEWIDMALIRSLDALVVTQLDLIKLSYFLRQRQAWKKIDIVVFKRTIEFFKFTTQIGQFTTNACDHAYPRSQLQIP